MMEKLEYKEFLKKFVNLGPQEILVTRHPFYSFSEQPEDIDFNPSAWYWINGGDKLSNSFLSESDFISFIDDEPIFIRYIKEGKVSRTQLEDNFRKIYNSLSCCAIRTIDRHIQVWYGDSMAELIMKAIIGPFESIGERKLQISPFEIPVEKENFSDLFQDIWKGKRNGDKIEDTVTDHEIITPGEFWRRINLLRTLEFSRWTGL